MLRAVPFKSAARVSEYFSQALVKEDYWSKGAKVAGIWHGKALEKLGIDSGSEVVAKDFESLSKNQHPETGETITVRNRVGRVVGMDVSFGVPKSVSLLFAFTGDQKITDLLLSANAKMMNAMERDAETQVRVGGVIEDRVVGNLAYATFLHHTSRPAGAEGIPDPHLHTHNFVFNILYDSEEERYKAAKFRRLKQNAPMYEAIGRAHLAKGLVDLCYQVRKVGKAFEIVGIPRSLIQKYSRRTMEIEKIIAERGIEDAVKKANVGALSRQSKSVGLSPQETLAAWTQRLTEKEKKIIQEVIRNKGQGAPLTITPQEAVDYALAHCFDKKSVAKYRDIFREAVAHGYGVLLPKDIIAEIKTRNLISGKIKGVEYCTTAQVLSEEQLMLDWVRRGKGVFPRFYAKPYKVKRDFLSDEQVKAVREMLHSSNALIGLQGASGVGKTTLLAEVVEGIENTGRKVYSFAVTASAVKTLIDDGFTNATTLKNLLINEKIQKEVRGQTVLLDEAGLVGNEDLLDLFKAVGRDTRILLAGDIFQHSPVSRGDSFRILQQTGVLRCSFVNTIIRQEAGHYRDAAQALANGDVDAAFGYLTAMGAVNEIKNKNARYRTLAEDYVESLLAGERPLLISPTHAESGKVTEIVRNHLQELGQIKASKELTRLVNTQWSDAQKTKPELYKSGMVIEFHQNAKNRIVRGSKFEIQGHDDDGNVLISDSKEASRILNLDDAKKFQVFHKREIDLAHGDMIRMTKNGYFPEGRRFNNGQTYKVARIYPSGSIKLDNGALMKSDLGHHISYGYVTTSYSSQSKTSKNPVFIAQSSKSLGASSLNQFYVSVTRGKEAKKFKLYTDSVEDLKLGISRQDMRMSAQEFIQQHTIMPTENEKDKSFPYDVTEKEKEAIFNEKGEFRYTPGFVRHDVGGNFEAYVAHRRSAFTGFANELAKEREAYQQGKQDGMNESMHKAKQGWSSNLNKSRNMSSTIRSKGLTPTAQKTNRQNWFDEVRTRKRDWSQSLNKTRGATVGEVKDKKAEQPATKKSKMPSVGSKSGKGMAVNRKVNVGGKNMAASTAKASPKKTQEAKGKTKGKAKAAPVKKVAPKPPVKVVKK